VGRGKTPTVEKKIQGKKEDKTRTEKKNTSESSRSLLCGSENGKHAERRPHGGSGGTKILEYQQAARPPKRGFVGSLQKADTTGTGRGTGEGNPIRRNTCVSFRKGERLWCAVWGGLRTPPDHESQTRVPELVGKVFSGSKGADVGRLPLRFGPTR